jgi:hypothetical protein
MTNLGGQIYQISLIHGRIEDLFGEAISAPRARRWRRAAGIPACAHRCCYEQAVLFLSAALLKREKPSEPLTPFGVKLFFGRNKLRIQAELARCSAVVIESDDHHSEVIEDHYWQEAVLVIRDRAGQMPSEPTLRRWCRTLGISFSSSVQLKGADIARLITYSKELSLGRKHRGKTLRARGYAA